MTHPIPSPFDHALVHFGDETTARYQALPTKVEAAGLTIKGTAGPTTALGVRLELAHRQLEEQPDIRARVGEALVNGLMHARKG